MEKEGGVKAAAEGDIVAAPGVPVACFKKTAGEEAEATFMERVKDYYNQFKENSAEKHWICVKDKFRAAGDYVSQKSSSDLSVASNHVRLVQGGKMLEQYHQVFGKKKVEPVVKDEEAGPVAVDSQ